MISLSPLISVADLEREIKGDCETMISPPPREKEQDHRKKERKKESSVIWCGDWHQKT